MWLEINDLLFIRTALKWPVLTLSAIIGGAIVGLMQAPQSSRVLLLAVSLPLLFITGVIVALLTSKRYFQQAPSALRILAKEHADLRAAINTLGTLHTREAQTEAIMRFMQAFQRHDESEEFTFYNEVGSEFPTRLAPRFEVFFGHHRAINTAVLHLTYVLGTPEFFQAVEQLQLALEDHIREEERLFPEIMRVAGPEILRRVGSQMS